jgi:hypothetical protein
LNCFVEAFAELGTDCGVVADLVYEFESRLVVEADSSHF